MSKNKIIAIILSIIFIYDFCIYGLSMFDYYNFIKGRELSSMSFSLSLYLDPFFYLFHLIAILQFIVSGFKKSYLIRISLLKGVFFSFVFLIMWLTSAIFIDDSSFPKSIGLLFILRFSLSILIPAINIYILRYLISKIKPQLIPLGDGNHTFDEVNKWQRFFHRFFDLLIVALVMYPSFEYIMRFLRQLSINSEFLTSILELDQSQYIITYFFITFYYLVVEGIFSTSIGKTILGNVIVNNIAERPNVGQRIGRSFARLIPFDTFSFLFTSRGWHDGITQTYVVKAEKVSEDNPS